MFNYQHANLGKEILAETTAFQVVPSKPEILEAHEVVHKCSFFWPEEVGGMDLIDEVVSLGGVPPSWCEQWGIGRECW